MEVRSEPKLRCSTTCRLESISETSYWQATPIVPHLQPDGTKPGATSAIACAIHFARVKQHLEALSPSPLFIDYNARAIAGTIETNGDGTVEDCIKTVTRDGVPPEDFGRSDVTKSREKPPPQVYDEALQHRVLKAQRVIRNLAEMKGCLASDYPFVFYCTLFESFTSIAVAGTGKVEMPGVNDHDGTMCLLVPAWV